ncbi:MAG: thylakoid-associated protein [Microcystaceae cyanobacterium]
MFTTDFFTNSQSQFNESQKKLTELWEEFQKQLIESQKKLIYIWVDSLRGGITQVSFSENFEKTLNLQRELIDSALGAQQVTVNLAIETQKQFWDNYFQSTQKMAQQIPNN